MSEEGGFWRRSRRIVQKSYKRSRDVHCTRVIELSFSKGVSETEFQRTWLRLGFNVHSEDLLSEQSGERDHQSSCDLA